MRIHLPVQGTWVWSLVEEPSTCCQATKPQLRKPVHSRAHVLPHEKPPHEKSTHCNRRVERPQLEKALSQQQRPSVAKKKTTLQYSRNKVMRVWVRVMSVRGKVIK